MNAFDKHFLLYFDINILKNRDGQVNGTDLGTTVNYFGTIIEGNARFYSADTDFVIHEGETVFIPKGCVYHSEWHGKCGAVLYSLPFIMTSDRENDIRFSLQKVDCDAVSLMEKICSGKETAPLDSIAAFYELYASVFPKLQKDNKNPITSSVMPAVRYIESSEVWDYDIPYLASLCGMSDSNFYAVFKKQMGCTPVEYKNKMRCIRVTELLRNSNYTVEYISQKLSFSSPMYMRKLLKKYTGKTPGLIRKEKTGSV